MRTENLSVLDRITLAGLEEALDQHTRQLTTVNEWTRFTWSVSRHRTFEQCKRRYYLSYYGSRRVREANSSIVSAIWWLKQVMTLRTWIGTVIHRTAGLAVKAHRDGLDIDPNKLLQNAISYYQDGFRASQRGTKLDGSWIVLYEHVYPDEPFSIDRNVAEELVIDLVNVLLDSEALALIRSLPPDTIREIDEPFQSFVLEDVPVLGKVHTFAVPDVLLDHGGMVEIIDWKTGDAEAASIRDQAGLYRLYAAQTYRLPEESIHVTIADLGSQGESIDPPGGLPTLAEARRFALDSIQAMLDCIDNIDYHTASVAKFPMTDDYSACQRCGFKRACWRHIEVR